MKRRQIVARNKAHAGMIRRAMQLQEVREVLPKVVKATIRTRERVDTLEGELEQIKRGVPIKVKGERGERGPPGRDGRDGKDGAPGKPGKDGAPGKPGPQGEHGINGSDGLDGRNGKDGAPGKPGTPGKRGAAGVMGAIGAAGNNGWSPVLAAIRDGSRDVLQLRRWIGGTGSTPGFEGQYIGEKGFTKSIKDALDIRGERGIGGIGPRGLKGEKGDPGDGGGVSASESLYWALTAGG